MSLSFNLNDCWAEFLANPLDVVNKSVQEHSKNEIISDPNLVHSALKIELTKVLMSEGRYQSIPSINDTRQGGCRVTKFRCMVQDMFDPEFCFGFFRPDATDGGKINVGLYMDFIENVGSSQLEMLNNSSTQRFRYYCISIPGENDWVKGAQIINNSSQVTEVKPFEFKKPADKRQSNDALDSGDNKRSKQSPKNTTNSVNQYSDKLASEQQKKESKAPKLPDLCFPFKDANYSKKACVVKVYDPVEPMKLNDVVEIIGILDTDSLDSLDRRDGSDEESLNAQFNNLELDSGESAYPYSLVPRIHALLIRPVQHDDVLSLNANWILKTREKLHAILSQALFGDGLAADYLICHLLSGVHSRKDVMALGAFPLNLLNLPKEASNQNAAFIMQLYELISKFTASSHYLPLSLQVLNNEPFIPTKDYEVGKLKSGMLQLPAGISLIVDETAMKVGKLDEKGVSNLKALDDLITWQKVDYDLIYQRLSIETDVNVLVISEGRSLLQIRTKLPLKIDQMSNFENNFSSIHEFVDESLSSDIRTYINTLRHSPYSIPSDVEKIIENDFVEMRRSSNEEEKVSADDLHLLLTLCRLMSLSFGEITLTKEMWQKTKGIEEERKIRSKMLKLKA